MQAARMNLRECSVRMRRCDLEGQEGASRAFRGAPLADRAPRAAATPLDAEHVQRGREVSMLAIKLEVDCGDAMVKQELDANHPQLWRDTVPKPDLDFIEGHNSIVKIEHDTDTITIKKELDIEPTELDIEPTVLQSRATALDVWSTQSVNVDGQGHLLVRRRSTSSGGGAIAAPFDTLFARSALPTDVKDEHYEDPGNTSSTAFVMDLGETDNPSQRTTRDQTWNNRFQSIDETVGTQERGSQYCVKTPTECYCKTDVGKGGITAYKVEMKYECDYCKYRTTRKRNLRSHISKKQYKCVQCEYNTYRRESSRIHMSSHTGVKPYKCDQCEYSASQKEYLKKHILTHMGVKPYKCDQCEYSACQKGRLKIHLRIHTHIKPYKCGQCEYSASHKNSLKIHMSSHTGLKPYKCDQCEYSASQKSHLKRHVRSHMGVKPYKCDQCEYSASQKGNLKRHMHTHVGVKPYKCDHLSTVHFKRVS